MGSATLTSGRTCTPTPSCPEAPPCTPVLLTVCRRRSPPWLPPPSRSRMGLPPRGSTPSGSEAPSWLPSPPSSRCGSPSRSTTSPALASSTGSASKLPTRKSPADVDLQAGVRRVRPWHRPQEVLLSCQLENLTQSLGPNLIQLLFSVLPFFVIIEYNLSTVSMNKKFV